MWSRKLQTLSAPVSPPSWVPQAVGMNDEIVKTGGEDSELDLGELISRALRVALKGRCLIPLTGLGALVLAVGVLSFVPNVYKSESTILVVEQQIPQNVVAPLSSSTVTQRLQTISQEVLSRASLLRIVEETRLYAGKNLEPDLAVELMRKSIGIELKDVTRDGGLGSFLISFSASSPALAQEVTRKLSALFIERHSERQVSRANSTADFFKERLAEKRRRFDDIQRQLQSLKIRYLGDLPENRLTNEAKAAEFRTQLQNSQSNLSRAKQQKVSWESMLSGNLVGRLTRLKAERATLLTRLTPKHPQAIAKDEEIAVMERAVASLQTGHALSAEDLARLAPGDPTVSQIQGQLEANRLEIEAATRDQKRYEALLSDVQRHINMAPAVEQQVSAMTREAELLAQEIGKLEGMDQQSTLSADMEKRQQGEQFRLIDPAVLPLKPVSPARFKMTAGAGLGGMVLGFLALLVLDLRRGAFHTEQQLRSRFSPPFVLGIPDVATPSELRSRKVRGVIEWVGCVGLTVMIAAIELYVLRAW